MANIGKNIMEARKRAGLTQEELASRVGYKTKSAINKIEMGTRDLPQRKIVQFAKALDTSPAALMGWIDEEVDKKNDAIASAVSKMRKEPEFFEVVSWLSDMYDHQTEKFASVKQMIYLLRSE